MSSSVSSDPLDCNSSEEGSVGMITGSSDGKTSEAELEVSCLGSTGSSSSAACETSGAHPSDSDSSASSERLPGASEDEVHGGRIENY